MVDKDSDRVRLLLCALSMLGGGGSCVVAWALVFAARGVTVAEAFLECPAADFACPLAPLSPVLGGVANGSVNCWVGARLGLR